MPDERSVIKLIDTDNDTWIDVNFQDLKEGDIFKLFEPDGMPVIDLLGFTIFEATSDPFINENNEWEIKTE